MRLALAITTALALLVSGCCAGPGPRRMIGPPPPDAGRDAPFFFPFDARAPTDATSGDAAADARALDADPSADVRVDPDAVGPDAPSDDAATPDAPDAT